MEEGYLDNFAKSGYKKSYHHLKGSFIMRNVTFITLPYILSKIGGFSTAIFSIFGVMLFMRQRQFQ